MSALSIEALTHGFGGRKALDAVSFQAAAGAFTVLLGPNGAGKTTLVSLATGLYAARAGDVRLFGASIRREPLRALSLLGVVFQAPTLDLDLTLAESLAYHGALHGLSRRESLARGRAALESIGLADRLSHKAATLSGGLRRRVEIARALLHRPRLLIVDEASTGLDVASRAALLAHIRALCRNEGLSVLWATHLLDEVEPADAAVVLHEGRVRFTGSAAELAGSAGLEPAFLQLTRKPAA